MKKLSVIGIGPGGGANLTGRARKALEDCEAIVGYPVYTALLEGEFPGKPVYTTPMRREPERCRMALALADEGRQVALVCSGDPGIYGMAGLCLELARDYPEVEVTVIPGITAACGGAALLGAPLMHDFAVISLSDLLTPWEKIETRLKLAAEGDFVLVLYNPASRSRPDHLRRACDILLAAGKDPETPCGTVRSIGREGESKKLLTLQELREEPADMFTTVFIGNSQTRVLDGWLVTPRGYLRKGEREK